MNQRDIQNAFIYNIRDQNNLLFQSLNGEVSNTNINMNHRTACHLKNSSLPTLSSKYKVVIPKENTKLKTDWQKIQLRALDINHRKSREEISFYMIGEELPSGTIVIRQIVLADNNLLSGRTQHNEKQLDNLVNNAQSLMIQGGKPILFMGHTHPDQKHLNIPNRFQNSWSFGDLYSAFCASDRYKNDNIQVINVLITPSMDINFMFYDRNEQSFYRFNEGIYTWDKSKNCYLPSNCYSDPDANALSYDLSQSNIRI